MVTRKEMFEAAKAGDFVPFPWHPSVGMKMDLNSLIIDTLQALYDSDAADLLLYLAGQKRGIPKSLNAQEQLFYRAMRNGVITVDA